MIQCVRDHRAHIRRQTTNTTMNHHDYPSTTTIHLRLPSIPDHNPSDNSWLHHSIITLCYHKKSTLETSSYNKSTQQTPDLTSLDHIDRSRPPSNQSEDRTTTSLDKPDLEISRLGPRLAGYRLDAYVRDEPNQVPSYYWTKPSTLSTRADIHFIDFIRTNSPKILTPTEQNGFYNELWWRTSIHFSSNVTKWGEWQQRNDTKESGIGNSSIPRMALAQDLHIIIDFHSHHSPILRDWWPWHYYYLLL